MNRPEQPFDQYLPENRISTQKINGEDAPLEVSHLHLTIGQFTTLFDNFLNLGGKQYREGNQVGKNLRSTHRTLQRQAICFCLGLIAGLSEQQYTDPRNDDAIKTAKKIKDMLETGQLNCGPYL